MNNTKWDELRLAMYGLEHLSPRWRTKDISGHVSEWDGEWFYHFRGESYESIEWVEVLVTSLDQDIAVVERLRTIHVPGHRIDDGYRIYGYADDDSPLGYL